MTIDNEYNLGDIVFLRTDREQLPRLVTRIIVTQSGILYSLANSTTETTHYEFEIATEINVLIKMKYD